MAQHPFRPRISIVILNYNGKRFLRECLTSVLRQRHDDGFEIILVDNASADGSVEYVRRAWAGAIASRRLRVVPLDTNTGFATGNNVGVRHASASSEVIVLLNNDVKVEPGWLAALVRPLENPRTSVVGASSISPRYNGDFDYWYGKRKMCESMNLVGVPVMRPMTREEVDAGVPRPFLVGGVCMAFRKREIKKPFDDDYFAYAEDVALCWEQRLLDREIVVSTKSRLLHYSGQTKNSSPKLSKFAVFHGTKNSLMNLFIFYEWKTIARLLPLLAAWNAALLLATPSVFAARAKAYWWVATRWPLVMRKRRQMQRSRKVSDKRIIAQLDSALLDEHSGALPVPHAILRAVNRCSRAYARLMLLRTRDLSAASSKG